MSDNLRIEYAFYVNSKTIAKSYKNARTFQLIVIQFHKLVWTVTLILV